MQGVLPVPSWLIPFWLIRWAAPLFFSKVIPLFAHLGRAFNVGFGDVRGGNGEKIVQRLRTDADGFYGSARAAGLVPALPPPEPRVVDVGVARPSPRSILQAQEQPSDTNCLQASLEGERRLRVDVEIVG